MYVIYLLSARLRLGSNLLNGVRVKFGSKLQVLIRFGYLISSRIWVYEKPRLNLLQRQLPVVKTGGLLWWSYNTNPYRNQKIYQQYSLKPAYTFSISKDSKHIPSTIILQCPKSRQLSNCNYNWAITRQTTLGFACYNMSWNQEYMYNRVWYWTQKETSYKCNWAYLTANGDGCLPWLVHGDIK